MRITEGSQDFGNCQIYAVRFGPYRNAVGVKTRRPRAVHKIKSRNLLIQWWRNPKTLPKLKLKLFKQRIQRARL